MTMEVLRDLCIKMQSLQDVKNELEDQLKVINANLDEVRLKKIPDLMITLELRTATFHGIGRVQLAEDVYASTREGKKVEAMQWLRDTGYPDMIIETYNASSLKALFRRQLKEGIDIPDDIFSVTPFTRASIVKA